MLLYIKLLCSCFIFYVLLLLSHLCKQRQAIRDWSTIILFFFRMLTSTRILAPKYYEKRGKASNSYDMALSLAFPESIWPNHHLKSLYKLLLSILILIYWHLSCQRWCSFIGKTILTPPQYYVDLIIFIKKRFRYNDTSLAFYSFYQWFFCVCRWVLLLII